MAEVAAAVMLGPGRVEFRSYPMPEVAEDAMLLKVTHAGICGTDKHVFQGHMPLKFPVILGHEFAGRVAAVGAKAHEASVVVGGPLKEGDLVAVVPSSMACGRCHFCTHYPLRTTLCPNRFVYGFLGCEEAPRLLGAFAEYVYVRPRSWLFRLSEDFPEERAHLIEPVAVAMRAVERAYGQSFPQFGEGYGPGSTCVVQGCGPIGLMAVAVLRHTGAARIIAVDLDPGRLALARELGADEVVDGSTLDAPARAARVRELSSGVGADLVIECVGLPKAFVEALDLVRRGGRIVEVGHYTDPGPVDLHPHQICFKDVDILGSWAYPQIQFKEAIHFLKRCTLPLEKATTHRIPLADFEKGLNLTGGREAIKVCVEP